MLKKQQPSSCTFHMHDQQSCKVLLYQNTCSGQHRPVSNHQR
uniref:Uncharacterized protein n=1 Tax=Arundo donax TaxID=35708 RepID=A0A0A9GCZ5_ARUDO